MEAWKAELSTLEADTDVEGGAVADVVGVDSGTGAVVRELPALRLWISSGNPTLRLRLRLRVDEVLVPRFDCRCILNPRYLQSVL